MPVVPLRDEPVPQRPAKVDFLLPELEVGRSELRFRSRTGVIVEYRVVGVRKGLNRPAHPVARNARIHPTDRLVLEAADGSRYEVGGMYVEISSRWGLVQ